MIFCYPRKRVVQTDIQVDRATGEAKLMHLPHPHIHRNTQSIFWAIFSSVRLSMPSQTAENVTSMLRIKTKRSVIVGCMFVVPWVRTCQPFSQPSFHSFLKSNLLLLEVGLVENIAFIEVRRIADSSHERFQQLGNFTAFSQHQAGNCGGQLHFERLLSESLPPSRESSSVRLSELFAIAILVYFSRTTRLGPFVLEISQSEACIPYLLVCV